MYNMNMDWERLRSKLIENYYPSENELKESTDLYKLVSNYIKKEHQVDTHFAGSVSRGTCMKGDKDIDLFLLFSEDISRKELEEKGLEIGKDTFNHFDSEPHVEYAEHPYTKGEIKGHEVEIVPCHDTSPENIKSSVDRTPHHSRWVKNNLDNEQKKDVVLLKKFLDAKNLYGSSLKTRGFSGYLCEILISEYGSFKKLLEEAKQWEKNKLIDPANHYENTQMPNKLVKKFKDEPLRVIDPVDSERNVASVLTTENYTKFIYNAIKFTDNPGVNHFETKKVDYTEFEIKQELNKRNHVIVLEMDVPNQVEDIVYPQLRKTGRRIEQIFKRNDFRIYTLKFFTDDEKIRFLIETDQKLSEIQIKKGPKIFHGEKHIEQFESKYDNTFIENDRLKAKTERKYIESKKLIHNKLIKDKEELKENGIPMRIAEKMEDMKFIEPIQDDPNWLNFLGEQLNVKK